MPLSHFEKMCKRYPDGIRVNINITREENKTMPAAGVACVTCYFFCYATQIVFYIHSPLLLISTAYGNNAPLWCLSCWIDHNKKSTSCLKTHILASLLLCRLNRVPGTHTLHFDSYVNPFLQVFCSDWIVVFWSVTTVTEPQLSLHCRHLPAQYQSCNDVMHTMVRMKNAGFLSLEILYRSQRQCSHCVTERTLGSWVRIWSRTWTLVSALLHLQTYCNVLAVSFLAHRAFKT